MSFAESIDQPCLPAGPMTLLPLLAQHAPAMARWLLDPQIYTYLDDAPPASAQVLAERYTRWQTRRSASGDEHWLNWAVRLNDPLSADGGALIGHVQATVLTDGKAWMAWVFDPAHWGHGHAYSAVLAMIDHLVAEHRVHTGLATVEVDNLRSVRLLARLGFVESPTRGDRASERLYVAGVGVAVSAANAPT